MASAVQGRNWLQAASDLTSGAATDTGDTSGYAGAAGELTNLASLPDSSQTAAQSAAFLADVSALDAFFQTPGLYQ